MYQIMTADEAMDLINDGDVIALNSFLGIDIPIELHEALYKRYQRTGSPSTSPLYQARALVRGMRIRRQRDT